MEANESSTGNFVRRWLPWFVAAGALILYLVTLDFWGTPRGLPSFARAVGWEWRPQLLAPVHFVVTYPVRWLPPAWQLTAFNLLAAVWAALTLALLARSVALLPQDRTRDQRHFERDPQGLLSIAARWAPPVAAVLICGLQLSFWEHAVTGTSEMFDLLLFAYVIRCLLEFRIAQKESWLYRMAFVLGLGITNNYAMIAVAVGAVVALIWIRGLAFFRWRFIGRVALCGLVGLLPYLILPWIAASTYDVPELNFGSSLRTLLGTQKDQLIGFPRVVVLLVSLTSIGPVIFLGVRWPASFGEVSAVGNALTNLMTHVIHGVFLLACLYVVFDPAFSPRGLGYGKAMLPYYYLGALSVGYFLGYFLLVFAPRKPDRAWQRVGPLRIAANYLLTALSWVAVVGVPAGLLYKNWPEIHRGNYSGLRELSEAAVKSLPARATVLSDDPVRLHALAVALNRAGQLPNHALLETAPLPLRAYHRYLTQRYPQHWPKLAADPDPSVPVNLPALLQRFVETEKAGELIYLHPSFGLYFEYFYLQPRQAVYQMKRLAPGEIFGPPLTAQAMQEIDTFWREFQPERFRPKVPANQLDPSSAASYMIVVLSRALTWQGVEMQRAGDLKRAGDYFARALDVDSQNPSALLNQDYNRNLQAGRRESIPPSEEVLKRLAPFGGEWDAILNFAGPPEEPTVCMYLASTFARTRLYRQAAQQLSRTVYFVPDEMGARQRLASVYVQVPAPDRALQLIAETRALPFAANLDLTNQLHLIQSEAWAYAAKNDIPKVESILKDAQQKYPGLAAPFVTLAEIYLSARQTTNALEVIERQLKLQPNDVNAHVNYGTLKMQQSQPEAAMQALNKALALDPRSRIGLINRAIAHLGANRLDEAQRDYETLAGLLNEPNYIVEFGLGEIAFRKKERTAALNHYEEYLRLAPLGTPERRYINERVKKLKDGSW